MQSKFPTQPVVIVGAGLAGLWCARELARRRVPVLLVDRRARVTDGVRTTGIFVRRTFEDFALPEDCLGPPIRHVSLYSPARRRLDLASEHDEFRIGRMADLYAQLWDHCQWLGAWVASSTAYVAATPRFDGVRVELQTPHGRTTVDGSFLVGADGASSRVARDLGLDQNRKWIVGLEEVYQGLPLDGPPRLDCYLDPRIAPGYLAWVAHDGVETHLGVGGDARRFRPARALRAFRASLVGAYPFSQARRIERRGGRIPVGGVLRRLACSHGLLVGDAAGAVSPLTAGGLDPAVRLSSLAARVIAEYLPDRDLRRLIPYSGDQFRGRFVARLAMRRAFDAISYAPLVEAACAALRLPGMRGLARHVFFGRGSFPDTAPRNLVARPIPT